MRFGPRHVQLASNWMPTVMVYGVSATMGMLYFTEWKAVLRYVPIYGSKYEQE